MRTTFRRPEEILLPVCISNLRFSYGARRLQGEEEGDFHVDRYVPAVGGGRC